MAEKGKFNMTNSFVKRNLVTIVMIPSLIAIHYGWVLLQNNEALIKKEERMELPIITAVKYVWSKMPGASDFQNESSKK